MRKPGEVNSYLQDVIGKLKSLLREDLLLNIPGVKSNVRLSDVVAGSVAKALIASTKGHAEFY